MSFFGFFVPMSDVPAPNENDPWQHTSHRPQGRPDRVARYLPHERGTVPEPLPANENSQEVREGSLNPADLAALVARREAEEATTPRKQPQRRAA